MATLRGHLLAGEMAATWTDAAGCGVCLHGTCTKHTRATVKVLTLEVRDAQECCDKRNKIRASQDMVKWNNLLISILLVTCIGGGAWLLYAGTPIIDSLDSLTSTLVTEVCTCLPPEALLLLFKASMVPRSRALAMLA